MSNISLAGSARLFHVAADFSAKYPVTIRDVTSCVPLLTGVPAKVRDKMSQNKLVRKGSLGLLLVFTLMTAAVRCVTACTLALCNDVTTASLPGIADLLPCHQHHKIPGQQTPPPCSHQVPVLAQAVSSEISHFAPTIAINLSAANFSVYRALNNLEALAAPGVAPPTLAAISSVILRI